MKNWIIIAAVGLMILTGGCVMTPLQVPLEPEIGKIGSVKPLPLKGALYIPAETRNYRYSSPDYILSKPQANWEYFRSFELPVGEAFTQAAIQTFPQLFQEIQVIPNYSGEDKFPLVIEVKIEEFQLALEYATFGYRPRGSGLLDVQGTIKARLRLIRPGKSPWEKVYEVPIPTDRLAVDPWTHEAVGKRVGEALNSLFKKIVWEIAEESNLPGNPFING